MRVHHAKNRVVLGTRDISFRTAVHLIADARHQPIGVCARMLGLTRKELALMERGKWKLTPEVATTTEGLIQSTFG
jgi:plasmid maintenance system antidote protein VapI